MTFSIQTKGTSWQNNTKIIMKINILLNLIFIASSLVGCHSDALLEPEIPDYFVINGDTIKIRNDKSLGNFGRSSLANDQRIFYGDTLVQYVKHPMPNIKKPDLSTLKNNLDAELKGKSFRMIVVGDGVAAGVREGGYFNEGMETSFPNLIALQMGIDFKQPYFDTQDYNGYGRAVFTPQNLTGGPIPKYKEVSNNTGYLKKGTNDNFELKPFTGSRIDNFSAFAFLNYDHEFFSAASPASVNRLKNKESKATTPTELYLSQKFDFIVVADNLGVHPNGSATADHFIAFPNGFEGYKNIKSTGTSETPKYSNRMNFLLSLSKREGLKGVMFTAPNDLRYPYYNWVNIDEVRTLLSTYGYGYLLSHDLKTLRPTARIDSLMGKNVHVNLKPFITKKEFISLFHALEVNADDMSDRFKTLNSESINVAKALNFALVDLHTIYERLFAGSYSTHDGYKVAVSDFFSSDGLNPSVLGQVIIANETIAELNRHYKLKIELINTTAYLRK